MFSPHQVYCVLDFETFSECDLKKCGVFEYSKHPSTEIICAAWRIGTCESLRSAVTQTTSIDWIQNRWPEDLVNAMNTYTGGIPAIFVAHNALFEEAIVRNVLYRAVPPARWLCTASLASALAIPRNLEGAAKAMGLKTQKDMEGNRLIQKWCKPRKPSKSNPNTRWNSPEELRRIIQYCATDVDTTVELFLALPMLTDKEREIWLLDQRINQRGFEVDRELVSRVLSMMSEETIELTREIRKMTGDQIQSANQRNAVYDYISNRGVLLPNLQKKSIDDALPGVTDPHIKRILEIRQAVSKASTAKYHAFEARSRHDGRCRDILVYHSASTGRWGGAGVQPQNFPRGTIKDTGSACDLIKTGDLDLVRLFYGDPMTVFSSCLRGCIIAPKGKTLDVADYAAIEARVLFWVADHEEGLNAFREGRDLYKEQASIIFGVNTGDVNSFQRFVGKTAILGSGYGMGPVKFAATCLNQGQEVSDDLAKAAIQSYRSTHYPVPKLWSNLGLAAQAAIENPGRAYHINHTVWQMHRDFLYCRLPSGRRLAYQKPRIIWEATPWGEKRPVLYHYGLNSITRKYQEQKTWGGVLTENVVQAIARDLMAEAMLRIEKAGWQIVLSVHDELVGERDLKRKDLSIERFCNLMAELPVWAKGCPVTVEGWTDTRYRK